MKKNLKAYVSGFIDVIAFDGCYVKKILSKFENFGGIRAL